MGGLWAAKWELALPILVLVGIYGGLVTINEAAWSRQPIASW